MSAPMSIGKWLRGARARSAQSGRLRRVLRGVLLVIIAIIALPYLLTPLYGWGRPVSVLMLTRWLSGAPVQREWVPLRQMGASLPLAVIVAEDSGFCDHRGIEWGALKQAIEDVSEGEVSGGGSTITQQTVKNLFFWPGRSYLRKALEVPLALWMDLILPKSLPRAAPADGEGLRQLSGEPAEGESAPARATAPVAPSPGRSRSRSPLRRAAPPSPHRSRSH
jgi:hypothetical protein